MTEQPAWPVVPLAGVSDRVELLACPVRYRAPEGATDGADAAGHVVGSDPAARRGQLVRRGRVAISIASSLR